MGSASERERETMQSGRRGVGVEGDLKNMFTSGGSAVAEMLPYSRDSRSGHMQRGEKKRSRQEK